jgi:hypothetical protein
MGTVRTLAAGFAPPHAGATAAERDRSPFALTWLGLSVVVAATALLAQIGADARWLAALGERIAAGWRVPDGLPFAAAPSDGWQNVPVLGELVFYALHAALSDRGLVLMQVTAVLVAFAVLARDMRAGGATDAARCLALVAAAVAVAPGLIIVRAQLFSLALFPLLVFVLRAEARSPSRRIFLVVPLIALWANLHGGVLVGVAVASAYLLVDRLRREPMVALGVVAASVAALLLTPRFLGSAAYYQDVLTSEAARRGYGLWAPLSYHGPFNVLFLLVGLPLVAAAIRARPKRWEIAVLLALGALSIHANRNTLWLVLFASVPAARALRLDSRGGRMFTRLTLGCSCLLGLFVLGALAQTPARTAAGAALVRRTAAAADGTPILADPLNAEQLALAGQRIWIGNPLDAFDPVDQVAYLDWLQGRPEGDRVPRGSCAVLLTIGSPPQRRLARNPTYRELGHDSQAVLYTRTACSVG